MSDADRQLQEEGERAAGRGEPEFGAPDTQALKARSLAIFLIGLLLLNPPLLSTFDADTALGGVPWAHLWLFAVWGLLIVFVAFSVRRLPAENRPDQRER